jgi:hypothetical protein
MLADLISERRPPVRTSRATRVLGSRSSMIFDRSLSLSHVASSGELNQIIHAVSHINPIPPAIMNDTRQPHRLTSELSSTEQMAGPKYEPLLNTDVTMPRSLAGNHWRITLAPTGLLLDSPDPMMRRAANSPEKLETAAVNAVADDQMKIPIPAILRGPNRSIRIPIGSRKSA